MGKHKYVVNAKTLASDLLACKKVFDNAEVPWIIMGGIVLGYARYKAIMEWDTDLDFAVVAELNTKQWKDVHDSFVEEGFKIKKEKTDFMCGGRLVPYNLWFFHKKGNFYESFPRSTPKLKFVEKAIWYDKPEMVDFLESKFPMPGHMNDYLICQYGKDWKTNIVKDHEAYYLDKRGSRDTSKWLTSRASKYGDLWPKTIKINDTMEGVE